MVYVRHADPHLPCNSSAAIYSVVLLQTPPILVVQFCMILCVCVCVCVCACTRMCAKNKCASVHSSAANLASTTLQPEKQVYAYARLNKVSTYTPSELCWIVSGQNEHHHLLTSGESA